MKIRHWGANKKLKVMAIDKVQEWVCSHFVLFALITAPLFLVGCATQATPAHRVSAGTETVFEKSYTLGRQQQAYTGQAVLSVKEYAAIRYTRKQALPTVDFVIPSQRGDYVATKDQVHIIAATMRHDNETFFVVEPANRQTRLLVRADGSISNRFAVQVGASNSSFVVSPYTISVNPPDARFKFVESVETETGSVGINFELVYSGTDGKSILFNYREYTSSNMARTPFFQSLTYDATKSRVRFRDFVIDVKEATNERIVYTVIEDGLASAAKK